MPEQPRYEHPPKSGEKKHAWEVVGLSRKATRAEIKKRRREIAKEHPDQNKGQGHDRIATAFAALDEMEARLDGRWDDVNHTVLPRDPEELRRRQETADRVNRAYGGTTSDEGAQRQAEEVFERLRRAAEEADARRRRQAGGGTAHAQTGGPGPENGSPLNDEELRRPPGEELGEDSDESIEDQSPTADETFSAEEDRQRRTGGRGAGGGRGGGGNGGSHHGPWGARPDYSANGHESAGNHGGGHGGGHSGNNVFFGIFGFIGHYLGMMAKGAADLAGMPSSGGDSHEKKPGAKKDAHAH